MLARTLLLALLLFAGALAEAKGAPTWDEVEAILEDRCTLCHDPSDSSGGLNLKGYGPLMEGGGSGPVIVPGDPDGSRLFRLVTRQEQPFMPEGDGPLSAEEVTVLRGWIAAGAPDPDGVKAQAPEAPEASGALTGPTERQRVMPAPLPLDPLVEGSRPASIAALAGAPGAPLVAVGSYRQLLLHHAESGEPLGVLPFPAGRVHHVRFSADGSLVFAAGGEGASRGAFVVWDVADGAPRLSLETEGDALLSGDLRADQLQIAVGGPSRLLQVFDTRSGALEFTRDEHTDWVTAVGYSPDGVLLASADRAGGVRLWESLSGEPYLELPTHGGPITALSWRADSNVLATACEDGSLRLFEVADGRQIKTWKAHGPGVLDVRFAGDGRLVSAGRDRRARLWAPDGKLLFESAPAKDLALQACLADDDRRLVWGDWAGTLRSRPSGDPKAAPTSWLAHPAPLEPQAQAARAALAQAERQQAALAAEAQQAKAALANAQTERAQAHAAVGPATRAAAHVPEAVSLGESLCASLLETLELAQAQAAATTDDPAAATRAAERARGLEATLAAARADLEAAKARYEPERARRVQAASEAAKRLAAAEQALAAASAKSQVISPKLKAAQATLLAARGLDARWQAELRLRPLFRADAEGTAALRSVEGARRAAEAARATIRAEIEHVTKAQASAKAHAARCAEAAAKAKALSATLTALADDLAQGVSSAQRVESSARERAEGLAPDDPGRDAALAAQAKAATRVKLLVALIDEAKAGLATAEGDARARAAAAATATAATQTTQASLAAARAKLAPAQAAVEQALSREQAALAVASAAAKALADARAALAPLRAAAR